MITIYYIYWNKSEHKMKEAEQVFYDVKKAIRFCWSMKDKAMFLKGWMCEYPEDNELMNLKIYTARINGF